MCVQLRRRAEMTPYRTRGESAPSSGTSHHQRLGREPKRLRDTGRESVAVAFQLSCSRVWLRSHVREQRVPSGEDTHP